MAKTVEKKDKSVESSNEMLERFLVASKDEHYAFEKPKNSVVSTGSLILDSIVKVRTGSTVRLTGKGFELGKSSQAFVFAANYMKSMPKSKTIYIKAEARLSPEMQARSGHKFVTKASEWEYGTVYIFPCNIFETVAELIEGLLKTMHENGEHLCVIVDSLDGLMLKDDFHSKGYGEATVVAGVQKLTKLMFRRLALPINYYDAMLLMTSQYSVAIQLDRYSTAPASQVSGGGGSSAGHQSDYIFEYGLRFKKDYILEDQNAQPDMFKNKILGVYSSIEIKKGSTDATGTKVQIPIKKGRVGCAIWLEKEIVDMALSLGLLEKKGAWYSFDPIAKEAKAANVTLKEQIQGVDAVYDYFETEKTVLDFFHKKIQDTIG